MAAVQDNKDDNKDNNQLDSDILELRVEVEEFIAETRKIHDDFAQIKRDIIKQFHDIDSIFSQHHRQKKVSFELISQLNELKSEANISSSNSSAISSLLSSLKSNKKIVDELGKSKRKTGSYFVSLIMGAVSVRIWNEGDKYKFKSEYNKFKERWIFIYFLFPLFQILFGFSMFIHQFQSILYLYYYSSLAIRENILSLNGSNIMSWWIYHHYWSIIISILNLLTYDIYDVTHSNAYIYLNLFFIFQGCVMLLQNDYQKKRHYARKALAKKTKYDIRTSEVIDERPHDRYKILIPALYVTYLLQLMVSIYYLYIASCAHNELQKLKLIQVIFMSICWFVLSIGNCSTLSFVLKEKKKREFEKRKSKLLKKDQ